MKVRDIVSFLPLIILLSNDEQKIYSLVLPRTCIIHIHGPSTVNQANRGEACKSESVTIVVTLQKFTTVGLTI